MRPFDSAVSPPTPGEEAVKAAHVKMSWTPALFRPGLVTARRQRWRLVGMKGYRESRFCVDFFIKGPIHVLELIEYTECCTMSFMLPNFPPLS